MPGFWFTPRPERGLRQIVEESADLRKRSAILQRLASSIIATSRELRASGVNGRKRPPPAADGRERTTPL